MLLVVLASLVVACSLSLSIFHLRAVKGALRSDTGPLVPKLLRSRPEDRVGAFRAAVPPESWEGRLGETLEESPSVELRAAAANEALGDLQLLFSSRARWAPSAIRIALLGGLLFGALGLIRGEWLVGVVVVIGSALGAGACAMLSSRAREVEKTQRKLADELVEALVPGAPRQESVGRRFKDVW